MTSSAKRRTPSGGGLLIGGSDLGSNGAAARGGFSISGANNGVLLSQLVHRGGHPKAIERMIRKVSGLSGTDVQIATNLQGILDVERTFLQTIEASRLAAAQAGRCRIFLK